MSSGSTKPASQAGPSFPVAWRSVSFATFCMSAGALLLLLGVVGLSLLIVFNIRVFIEPRVEGMATRDQMLPATFFGITFVLVLGGATLWLAGLCLCCLVPADTGARPLAAAAALCWLLSLLIALQVPLAPLVGLRVRPPLLVQEAGPQPGDGAPQRVTFVNDLGFGLAGLTLAIASGSFTMGFVCAAAHHFKNEKLARSARWLLAYLALALPACALIGFVHTSVADAWRNQPWYWIDLPFGVAVPVVIVVACVWLVRLLGQLRFVLRIAEENALAVADVKPAEKT